MCFSLREKRAPAEIVGMASLFRCRLLSTHSGNEKISEIISRTPESHGTYLLAPYVESTVITCINSRERVFLKHESQGRPVEDGKSIATHVGFEPSSTKSGKEAEQVTRYLIRPSTGFAHSWWNDEFTRTQQGSKSNNKLCVFSET